MSRIGKIQRIIPSGVSANMEKNILVIKGPKGQLSLKINPEATIVVADNSVSVDVVNKKSKKNRAVWGTYSSIIDNMICGVTTGFKKQLEINGVGYKANMKGVDLVLEVGYSHPIVIKPPTGIKFTVEKNLITIEGFDKQLVGEQAAQIRRVRKPEPYKGKGIKYIDEVIRRKAGKTAGKGAA